MINFDVFYQSYLKIFLSHKICIPFLSVTFMIKARIFFTKRGCYQKIGLKIERTWHYLFLIDKAKILDLLSLGFIEQNK